MRSHLKKYISLTKKEWNGMVVLVVLILIVLAAPYIYSRLHNDPPVNFNDFNKAAALLNKAEKADSAESDANAAATGKSHKVFNSNKLKYGSTIELNTSDSTQLKRVHGIGGSFAMRIIRYRNRLGGFYDKAQLKEIPGIDAAKYAEIKDQFTVDRSRIVKLNINTISFASLRECPYLNYKQSGAVIAYRNQHGKYTSGDDLKNVAILTPEILNKLAPYLDYK